MACLLSPSLDLKVPNQSPLIDGLLAQWPVYAAYLISFLFILIMWINHHWMLEHIIRVDGTFMLLNGLLLLGITVVPFPTNVVAQYVLTRSEEHTSELQSHLNLVCRLLLEKKKMKLAYA